MKTAKLILLCLSGMLAMQSATAQSRSEKKAQTERNVREAINADHYKINVDYMQPMKGRSRALTSDYSIEIRNDSVFLPALLRSGIQCTLRRREGIDI